VNKNSTYAFVLLALSLLIVLPVIDFVNVTVNGNTGSNSVLFATGSPMPPPTPDALNQLTLVGTGSPMPPPTPDALSQLTLVATGSPMPPPTPDALSQLTLVATGSPMPPPTPDSSILSV
jgi:hypothetical protein